jgi:putative heme iron utilization protein
MTPEQADSLRAILLEQRVAALGTLHDAQPFVSMVPFALVHEGAALVIHVSQLAAHTRDMLLHPQVSVLVMAPPAPDTLPQALPRVTIQGEAEQLEEEDEPLYVAARAAYLARFPDSEPIFGFGDFSLFLIRPSSLRLVGGFAQARTLAPEDLVAALKL